VTIWKSPIRVFALAALTVSCELVQAGGCDHTYREPVLTLQRVNDPTGQVLPVVILDSLTLNNRPLELRFGIITSLPAFGVTSDGSALTCSTPCGFGSEPGRYEFWVRGQTAERVTINASYATFHGGCPSWNDDGTTATVSLRHP